MDFLILKVAIFVQGKDGKQLKLLHFNNSLDYIQVHTTAITLRTQSNNIVGISLKIFILQLMNKNTDNQSESTQL